MKSKRVNEQHGSHRVRLKFWCYFDEFPEVFTYIYFMYDQAVVAIPKQSGQRAAEV